MEATVQQYHVDKQCSKIQKKQFLIKNDRLLNQIISQDIMNIVVNSLLDINTSVNMNSSVAMNDSVNYVEMYNNDLSIAKVVLMANLSSYGSDVLSEAPHSKITHNDMLNQSVQEM
ncbi:hypothetical protein Tco_0045086 [Tanacetum coccineum]